MFQLKNVIHRTSVPLDPQDNMKAAEDFIEIVLESHILTAAKHLLSINPNYSLQETCKMIVDNFVILTPQSQDKKHSVCDGIHLYACEVVTLGLIWYN